MESTTGATRHTNPPGRETPSTAHQPEESRTETGSGAFQVPSLSTIKSTHNFATKWRELHREIPLTPVRRQTPGPKRGGTSPKSALWVPVVGWWDEPHTGPELIRLLKADPTLGAALRLGRRGPKTWLVDIVLRNLESSKPALDRMLGPDGSYRTASWRDEEGIHLIFVGDDRLAGLEPLVVGAYKGKAGNPHYASLEIRLGSADPATSLAVLPPTPLGNGKPRTSRNGFARFSLLPDGFYADLEQFARATNVGADDTRSAWAAPEADAPSEPSAARPKPTGKVVALRGPEDHQSGVAPLVEPPAKEVQGTPSSSDLAALAAKIQEEVRAGDSLMFQSLDHYRQAGEMLEEAKARIGHGGFERFVEEHCGFSTETANVYKRVFLDWPKVKAMREANPQSATDLTLAQVVKQLAKPRKTSGTGGTPATPEAIDAVVAEDLNRSPTGPDVPPPYELVVEPARTAPSAPRPGNDRGDHGPAATVACSGAGDPPRPAGMGEAPRTEILKVDDNGARTPAPATGYTPPGVASTEETRRQAEDLKFLTDPGPIRALREKLRVKRHFDADATLWRLLQGIAGEILARESLTGRKPGYIASIIVAFVLGRPPGEWDFCPTCDGVGRLKPEGERCADCEGRGYLIPL
jgi:hypothetical protein